MGLEERLMSSPGQELLPTENSQKWRGISTGYTREPKRGPSVEHPEHSKPSDAVIILLSLPRVPKYFKSLDGQMQPGMSTVQSDQSSHCPPLVPGLPQQRLSLAVIEAPL